MDRVEIEMVRRLVQQQSLGMTKQRLRQQHADFLSALQIAHLLLVKLFGNVQPIEQNCGIALGGVSILFGDDAFEFAQTHAVIVGQVVLGEELLALFNGLPQAAVSHDHGVDHAIRVKGKLILPQDSQLARAHYIPLLGLELSGEDIHQSRLAGAVRASEAIAFSGREGDGDVVEQYFGAVAHAYVAN